MSTSSSIQKQLQIFIPLQRVGRKDVFNIQDMAGKRFSRTEGSNCYNRRKAISGSGWKFRNKRKLKHVLEDNVTFSGIDFFFLIRSWLMQFSLSQWKRKENAIL